MRVALIAALALTVASCGNDGSAGSTTTGGRTTTTGGGPIRTNRSRQGGPYGW
jgi:hypothetical protein